MDIAANADGIFVVEVDDQVIGYITTRIETLACNPIGKYLYPSCGFQEVARQIHYVMPLGVGSRKLPAPYPYLPLLLTPSLPTSTPSDYSPGSGGRR